MWALDWTHFTPWSSFSGGVILGVAAGLFIVLNGRILGISGIVGGLLRPRAGDIGWRVSFLLGLAASVVAFAWLAPAGMWPAPRIDASYGLITAAGLLVGLGTRLGSGCTSGHGVCGLSRLSPRSLAATGVFMGAGALTVFVARHVF
jgi:uncharacterized membrane protein YedE/YeeE